MRALPVDECVLAARKIAAALRTMVPGEGVIEQKTGRRHYVTDGRTAYRALPRHRPQYVRRGPAELGWSCAIDLGGNDWFVIPVELNVGSLYRTRSLVITDTFGIRTLIKSSSELGAPSARRGAFSGRRVVSSRRKTSRAVIARAIIAGS